MEDLEWINQAKNILSRVNSFNDKAAERILSAYLLEDRDEKFEIKEDVESLLSIYSSKLLFSKKPMLACPSKEEASGEVIIGKVLHAGKELYEFGLNKEEMIQHQLILGRSGSGKTTLIMNEISELIRLRIPFIAFDFKRDLRHLIKHFPELWVFRYEDLRINFLQPPPKVSIQKWEQIFCDLYSFNYGWFHGSRNLMQEYLHELYEEKGGKATLPQLYRKIKEAREQTRKREEYYDVVTNRLFSTVTNLGKVIDCERSFPIEKLLEHFVVIELDQLARDEQNLLVEFFLFWIYEYRKAHSQRGKLLHCLIFDEAKRIFDATKEFRESTQETGVAPIDIITDEIRDFGGALIVSDQEPSKLTHSIKANTYCKIVGFLGHGKDISDIAEAMDLDEDEREALTKLERGEWLVKLAGRYTKPFMIRSRNFPLEKNVSDEELKERMKPVIEELSEAKLKAEVKQRSPIELPLSEDAWKLLIHIHEHPFQGMVGRTKELKLSWRRIELAKQELVERGLVNEKNIQLIAKKPTLFLELTEEALNLLESKGLDTSQWKHIGNVGFEHILYQVLIRYEYQKLGYEAHIEVKLPNGKRVDVLAVKENKKIGVEIELNPYNEQANKTSLLKYLDELYVLLKEEKDLKIIKARLSNSDKIKLLTIRDFLYNIERSLSGVYFSNRKQAGDYTSRSLIGGQND
jgi:hypothetical protein